METIKQAFEKFDKKIRERTDNRSREEQLIVELTNFVADLYRRVEKIEKLARLEDDPDQNRPAPGN